MAAGDGKVPTLIRGVLYKSQREAARALGVHVSTIRGALERGTVDYVGCGRNYHNKRKVWVDGQEVESQRAAARMIGVGVNSFCGLVTKARKRGEYELTLNGFNVEIEKEIRRR